jgi:hypothetical protein
MTQGYLRSNYAINAREGSVTLGKIKILVEDGGCVLGQQSIHLTVDLLDDKGMVRYALEKQAVVFDGTLTFVLPKL